MWLWNLIFLQVDNFSSQRPSYVQCPRENLFAYFITFSEFEIHCSEFPLLFHSMSLSMDMKMIHPSSGSKLRPCKSSWIFLRISNDVRLGKIFHSNSIGCPSFPSNSLKIGLEILYLIFHIFDSLLNFCLFRRRFAPARCASFTSL